MSEAVDISVRESEGIVHKKPPSVKKIPVPFEYSLPPDGIDENLLVLLHGLGELAKCYCSVPHIC